MLQAPDIDPVIFRVGPLDVHWYGLMYVLGFVATFFLVRYQARKFGWPELEKHLDNILLFLVLGVIVGGRLGYVLFYNLDYYLENPLEILSFGKGGMSFHGGCLGVIVGGWLYCRKHGLDFWKAADVFVVTVPIGLALGRIGNFINQELYGRVTDVPWGMVFRNGGPLPRHPSQLYEAFLEGFVLFVILWLFKSKPWRKDNPWGHGTMMGLFILLYGVFRFMVEFVREPDAQLGYVFYFLTMGQILSLVMILFGGLLFFWRLKR